MDAAKDYRYAGSVCIDGKFVEINKIMNFL